MKFIKEHFDFISFVFVLVAFIGTISYFNHFGKVETKNADEVSKKIEYNFGKGTEKLEITGDRKIDPGEYQYSEFVLTNSGITIKREGIPPAQLVIRATKRIYIDKDSMISLSGVGFLGANENVADGIVGVPNYEFAGGGGNGISAGGMGDCRIKTKQNSYLASDESEGYGGGGSKGEKTTGIGGNGGGYLFLSAPEIVIDGKIIVNGLSGSGTGGGGSGGKIVLLSPSIKINGLVSANGGKGGNGQLQGAGGGSGGLIFLSSLVSKLDFLDVSGGVGGMAYDIYTGCNGEDGKNGKIIILK